MINLFFLKAKDELFFVVCFFLPFYMLSYETEEKDGKDVCSLIWTS